MPTISVQALMGVMIITVGIISAAIAFAPLYVGARVAVIDMFSTVRSEVGTKLQLGVADFFNKPQAFVTSLMLAASLGSIQWDNHTALTNWFSAVSISSGLGTYVGFDDKSYVSVAAPAVPGSTIHLVKEIRSADPSIMYRSFYNSSTKLNVSAVDVVPTTYDVTQRPWYHPLYHRQSWSRVYLDISGNFSVLTAGGPFVDAVSGAKVGAFAMDFPTSAIKSYLANQHAGITGRVLLVDRATRGFLGSNWEVSSVVNNSGGVLVMATLRDVAPNDAMFGRAFDTLGESQLLDCVAPCAFKLVDSRNELNNMHVDVLAVTDPFGLDMRLILVLMPSDYLTGVVEQSRVSIGASAAAIFVLIVVAVAFGHFSLTPLRRLETKLYRMATLKDFDLNDSGSETGGGASEPGSNEIVFRWSFLQEISNIESAFLVLQEELHRVKSFLPQSCLQFDSDLEDDDAAKAKRPVGDDDDEGSFVFSESQSLAHVASGAEHTELSSMSSSSSLKRRALPSIRAVSTAYESFSKMQHLNLNAGLFSKEVSLLAVNATHFHRFLDQPILCEKLLSKYIEAVETIVVANKGVVDHFSGDRVFVSFNASNHVSSHATRAAAAAHHICEKFASLPPGTSLMPFSVQVACASGRVLCGNMGSTTLRRYTLFGAAVNHVHVLLQMHKHLLPLVAGEAMDGDKGRRCYALLSTRAIELMEYDYLIEPIGVVLLPTSKAIPKKGSNQPGDPQTVAASNTPREQLLHQGCSDAEALASAAAAIAGDVGGQLHSSSGTPVPQPLLPGSGDGPLPPKLSIIGLLRGPKECEADEWMYQLQNGGGKLATDLAQLLASFRVMLKYLQQRSLVSAPVSPLAMDAFPGKSEVLLQCRDLIAKVEDPVSLSRGINELRRMIQLVDSDDGKTNLSAFTSVQY